MLVDGYCINARVMSTFIFCLGDITKATAVWEYRSVVLVLWREGENTKMVQKLRTCVCKTVLKSVVKDPFRFSEKSGAGGFSLFDRNYNFASSSIVAVTIKRTLLTIKPSTTMGRVRRIVMSGVRS